MGVLKGRNGSGAWIDASVVYARTASVWEYAKAYFIRKSDGTWERAWTDCRLFDAAGGRDWSAPTSVVTFSGSCSTRTQTTVTTRTKEGCPDDVRSVTVAAPNCTGCTGTPYVSNSCDGCGSITTTPGTGGCPDSSSGSCGSWNAETTSEISYGGTTLYYGGPAGYYYTLFGSPCRSCSSGCYADSNYYVTICSLTSERRFVNTFCGPCQNIFGNPC